MATPTIAGDVMLESGYRMLFGTVTLDGSNPTDIALSGYLVAPIFAIVQMDGSVAPAVDPSLITSNVSGTTLNIYAWKVTTTTDTTLIASTDSARVVDWLAIGASVR